MPDISQVDNTCLPASVTNLLLWFGQHGYPKLIPDPDANETAQNKLLRLMMIETGATYNNGTLRTRVTEGVSKYIHQAGYGCTVTYHGFNAEEAFDPAWLKENEDPNKGFVLILSYVQYEENQHRITGFYPMGHAVTLVSADSDILLIHDPAHYPSESGRKIVSSHVVDQVSVDSTNVGSIMMISGTYLDTPPSSQVVVVGAVRIVMYSNQSQEPSTLRMTPSLKDTASTASSDPSVLGWILWLVKIFSGH